jgi:hypothetical protein
MKTGMFVKDCSFLPQKQFWVLFLKNKQFPPWHPVWHKCKQWLWVLTHYKRMFKLFSYDKSSPLVFSGVHVAPSLVFYKSSPLVFSGVPWSLVFYKSSPLVFSGVPWSLVSYKSSPLVFSGVPWSLVFYVVFWKSLFVTFLVLFCLLHCLSFN